MFLITIYFVNWSIKARIIIMIIGKIYFFAFIFSPFNFIKPWRR